jgi:predicted AAA+ superfamily ATPase
MGNDFNINHAISQGTLPKIATLWAGGNMADAQAYLRSYVSIYIKEEIQAEALTRNVGAFQRFLSVAAQSNGQVIEFSNIARECSVPASTVKEYYQIIEDTLLGFLLWPFDHNERKKARPKHYFFDTGVVRAMQGRLVDAPTPIENGFLFETWFINECIRLRDYAGSQVEFSFWRKKQMEIDLLLSRGGTVRCGVECKTGSATISADTVSAFRAMFPGVDLIIASLADEHPRKRPDGVEILPWKKAIERIADYL